ncbi:hypothetical protein WJX74_001685 [Apatococcus lobatus]|uniref:Uncharacterized protein n=2 Tax=Apatococcus TaxID=904362 RepID=A0AAW1TB47_9CHLO
MGCAALSLNPSETPGSLLGAAETATGDALSLPLDRLHLPKPVVGHTSCLPRRHVTCLIQTEKGTVRDTPRVHSERCDSKDREHTRGGCGKDARSACGVQRQDIEGLKGTTRFPVRQQAL